MSDTTEEPKKYICPDCSEEVDEDCDTKETPCYYCPILCETCGYGTCDSSC
jgi:hypothetical protein